MPYIVCVRRIPSYRYPKSRVLVVDVCPVWAAKQVLRGGSIEPKAIDLRHKHIKRIVTEAFVWATREGAVRSGAYHKAVELAAKLNRGD
jgi:hypothetical protein